MALNALIDQFVSFFGGPKLIAGAELRRFAAAVISARSGIVAGAGGTQALAVPLPAAMNEVDTVASANDSVMLPPAIPGTAVWLANGTTTSMQVFGQASNINNGGLGDTIAIQGSTSQVATATGVAQAGGVKAWYVCTKMGQWQRGSTA